MGISAKCAATLLLPLLLAACAGDGQSSITYTDGKTYSGLQDMASAHAGLGITSDQYDYFISKQVVPALTDNGVSMDDVTQCFAPVVTDANFKASIVGK